MRSKALLMVVVVIIAVIAVGVGVGLLAGHGSGGPQPVNTQASTTPEPNPAPAPVKHTAIDRQPAPIIDVKPIVTNEPMPIVQASNLAVAVSTNTDLTETNWEEKIDDIVGGDEPDTNKVKHLFALFPKLPEEGQEEAAQHLSNLVDDDDYSQLGDLLKNDKLSEGVLDELLADVLNRPNNLKLPLLLDVASDPNHAKRDEAKDLLELYLGDDYGSDWNSWGQHMTNWMQQNPD